MMNCENYTRVMLRTI